MKEKLTHNLGMKLLSIIIASLMWIVIINIDNPVKTVTINNVEVQIKNEHSIQSLNKVYEIVEGETVNVRVKGKRNVVSKLRASDIEAVADLSTHNEFYAVPITVECPGKKNEVDVEITGKVRVMKIALEDVKKNQFKVTVVQKGRPEAGVYIGSAQPSPNMIEISGAKSQIQKIGEVRVYLDVNGVSEDFSTKITPRVFDKEGEDMDTSRMIFDTQQVSVAVNVLQTKTVPIEILLKGEPAYGYQFTQKDYEPQEIVIAAKANVLEGIKSLPITIDIDGKKENVETEVDLTRLLQKDNVLVVGDTKVVTLRVLIEKLINKEFQLTANDIKPINLPSTLQFSFTSPDKKVYVKVMGLEKELNRLTPTLLGAYIDLQNAKAGTRSFKVQLGLEGKYTVLSNPGVLVELTKVGNSGNTGSGDNNNRQTASPKPSTGALKEDEEPTQKPTSSPKTTKTPIPSDEEIEDSSEIEE